MNDLQNPGQSLISLCCVLVSIISGMIASITDHLEIYLRGGAAAVAIVSGFFAIRYYYYAAEKAKAEVEQLHKNKSIIP